MLGLNANVDYRYLEQKVGIKNGNDLKEAVLNQLATVNANALIEDVRGFLFDSKDEKVISLFPKYLEQVKL